MKTLIMDENKYYKYDEVLQEINGQENHLLLGNGFNRSLNVDTSYRNIFEEMMRNNLGIYKDAKEYVIESGYDLELFIERLQRDIKEDNIFLHKYVHNKVKIDFMKATQSIVRSEINKAYKKYNQNVYMLLQNFTNYFTLNYDPFLYMYLLKFKHVAKERFLQEQNEKLENDTAVMELSFEFIEEEINKTTNNLYTRVKELINNGSLQIRSIDGRLVDSASLQDITKTYLNNILSNCFKEDKTVSNKDLKKVIDIIWEEKNTVNVLDNVDDGYRRVKQGNLFEYVYEVDNETQNLFHLHGAFHIYSDGHLTKKITQTSEKALSEIVEEVISNEDKEIVCVFEHSNKEEIIKNSPYLQSGFNKLKQITGNMVIIGSSLSDNDNHIFEQITKSDISKIFISHFDDTKKSEEKQEQERKKKMELAMKKFSGKEVCLFSTSSISYNK